MFLSKRLTLSLFILFAGIAASDGLVASSSLSATAQAQTNRAGLNRALGNWAFKSQRYRDETCQISGRMQIRPGPETGELIGEFTSVEACEGQKDWIVEQTSAIRAYGDQLAMRSSIVNFIESEIVTDTYMPDHFLLDIHSTERMSGQLISAVSVAVEFTRQQEPVS